MGETLCYLDAVSKVESRTAWTPVDRLHGPLKAAPVRLIDAEADRADGYPVIATVGQAPWAREIEIRDVDGNRLRIDTPIEEATRCRSLAAVGAGIRHPGDLRVLSPRWAVASARRKRSADRPLLHQHWRAILTLGPQLEECRGTAIEPHNRTTPQEVA